MQSCRATFLLAMLEDLVDAILGVAFELHRGQKWEPEKLHGPKISKTKKRISRELLRKQQFHIAQSQEVIWCCFVTCLSGCALPFWDLTRSSKYCLPESLDTTARQLSIKKTLTHNMIKKYELLNFKAEPAFLLLSHCIWLPSQSKTFQHIHLPSFGGWA